MGLITIGGLPVERPVSLHGVAIEACVDRHGNVVWRYEPGGGDEPGGEETVFIPYTFVAISDAHYATANAANEKERLESLCVYLAAHMPDMIIASGDLANATNYKTTLATFTSAGIPCKYGEEGNKLHWAWGNHENNSSTSMLDELCKAFDGYLDGYVGAGASKSHWFDVSGDRFIILHFRNMSGKRAQFTTDDMTMLQNALNTAGDRRVFLIQHCPDFDNRATRPMCGDWGKDDAGHWEYDAADITWNGSTMDVRDVFRSILDAHVAAHPGKLIWLHGHTHKPVAYRRSGFNGENMDDTYFGGNGWTVHIPSLGRPQTKENGVVTTYGEWAVFTVNRDAVSVSYRHVEGNTVTDDTVTVLDGYGFDIPCAGIGVPAEDGGTWVVRLAGGELYVDEAPAACVRMEGNELILEDAG